MNQVEYKSIYFNITTIQLSIPPPPKKYSRSYAMIAVCQIPGNSFPVKCNQGNKYYGKQMINKHIPIMNVEKVRANPLDIS